MSFLAVLVLLISVVSIADVSTLAVASKGENDENVVGTDEEISPLYEIGNVIDRYSRYVLLEVPEDKISSPV